MQNRENLILCALSRWPLPVNAPPSSSPKPPASQTLRQEHRYLQGDRAANGNADFDEFLISEGCFHQKGDISYTPLAGACAGMKCTDCHHFDAPEQPHEIPMTAEVSKSLRKWFPSGKKFLPAWYVVTRQVLSDIQGVGSSLPNRPLVTVRPGHQSQFRPPTGWGICTHLTELGAATVFLSPRFKSSCSKS